MQRYKGRHREEAPLSVNMGISYPFLELTGNRRVTMEGSTGILLYEDDQIKINSNKVVVSFFGRGLRVKCISKTCVEIDGFITKIEFMS